MDQKLVFGLFRECNFKYGTKKLHTCLTRHETQILSRIWHELSFMPSFARALPGEAHILAPYFYARTLIVFTSLLHAFTLMLTP